MNNKALITKAYSDAGVVDIISNIVSCQHATMITNDLSFATPPAAVEPNLTHGKYMIRKKIALSSLDRILGRELEKIYQ